MLARPRLSRSMYGPGFSNLCWNAERRLLPRRADLHPQPLPPLPHNPSAQEEGAERELGREGRLKNPLTLARDDLDSVAVIDARSNLYEIAIGQTKSYRRLLP